MLKVLQNSELLTKGISQPEVLKLVAGFEQACCLQGCNTKNPRSTETQRPPIRSLRQSRRRVGERKSRRVSEGGRFSGSHFLAGSAQTLAWIAFRVAGKSEKYFPGTSKFAVPCDHFAAET